MSYDVVTHVLSADVADAGTFTIAYPNNRNAGDYTGGHAHMAISGAYGTASVSAGTLALSFGTSSITVTNNSGVTWAAQTEVYIQLDRVGADTETRTLAHPESMADAHLVVVNLGAPDTADVDGILAAYTGSAPALDGALVSGGVATFDVPRNIVVDSGGADTAVLTFTGTDVFGNAMAESITLNGTTAVAGKKAFKTVTGVSSSAAIANGAFAGPGDALGLPVFLPEAGLLLAELEDGAAPTAGTILAGVTAEATATTGDVRGTYDPNSACDGSKSFQLVLAVPDPSFRGVTQYAA